MLEHKIDELKDPRAILEWACANGYIFHGSTRRVQGNLEPRKANDAVKESGNREAVYLTINPLLAMFTALTGGKDVGIRRNKTYLEITDTGEVKYPKSPVFEVKNPDQVADEGFVYIFDQSQADEKTEGEYLAYKPIRPLTAIKIRRSDLKYPIGVIQN